MGLLDPTREWEPFRALLDRGVAEALAARLESEGVPTQLESRRLESAVEAHFVVYVEKNLAHRARWILAQLPPEEAEVYYMATGKLPEGE
jgi:hypothetical protein